MSYLFGLTEISLGRYVFGDLAWQAARDLGAGYIGSTAKGLSDLVAGKVEFGVETTNSLGIRGDGDDCCRDCRGIRRQKGTT